MNRLCIANFPVLFFLAAAPAMGQQVEWTQRALGTAPSPRANQAMAFDSARGIGVLFGGDDNNSGLNGETWEWDGIAWIQRLVGGPSLRVGHAMSYDSARGMTVFFGGSTSSGPISDETWVWDGTAWARRFVSGPSPRTRHSMAYDSVRGVTVLFGGYNNGVFNADTWEWNGSNWAQRFVSGPSSRYDHRMAYDSSRGTTVLFGGNTLVGGISGDTWEWNGSVWSQRAVTGPSPRYVHAMSFDASRAVTVLFGGFTDSNNGETWEWNGSSWTQRAVLGPAGRQGHGMIYDSTRSMTVLFGGWNGNSVSGETWVFACAGPSITSQPTTVTPCPTGHVTFSVTANTASGPATYLWQWQLDGETAWLPIVSGVNSLANVPQFEATGTNTFRVSIRPVLSPSGTRVWPNPGYRFRAVVSDTCKSVMSIVASLSVCPADLNCDGGIDFFDYLDFVDVFSSNLQVADFNDDGGIDFFDYLDFVDAFSIGC